MSISKPNHQYYAPGSKEERTMNAMMIANEMNKTTKTHAMNATTMEKETTTVVNGTIEAIVYEEGNLTCDDRIEGLQEHWSLSRSGARKSLMHDSIETSRSRNEIEVVRLNQRRFDFTKKKTKQACEESGNFSIPSFV